MKLINIKKMNPKQARAYRICLAKSARAITAAEALEALMNQITSLEPEMKVLGRGLTIPRVGRIDLVCVDGAGSLTLVQVSDELSPEELGCGLMKSEWVRDNIDMFQHIYSRKFRGEGIRLWQVARQVLPGARALLANMNGQGPEVFTCEALDLGGDAWIVVRRYDFAACGQGERDGNGAPLQGEPAGDVGGAKPVGIRSVLTREEIDDFFTASGEEEITSGGSIFKDY